MNSALHTFACGAFLAAGLASPVPAARGGDCPAVQVTCPTQPNSIGVGATLRWQGDCGLLEGTLVATGMPAHSLVMFIYGSPSLPAPYGSGTLCVNPGWIAYRGAADSAGVATFSIAANIEEEDERWILSPFFPSTTVFQALYRDTGAPNAPFNLSNGLLTLLK